ncbi:hypothetical protein Trydic_g2941, partial [Trypoxylus dichotomus]
MLTQDCTVLASSIYSFHLQFFLRASPYLTKSPIFSPKSCLKRLRKTATQISNDPPKPRPRPKPKVVVNPSSRPLSDSEELVLAKGLNYG